MTKGIMEIKAFVLKHRCPSYVADAMYGYRLGNDSASDVANAVGRECAEVLYSACPDEVIPADVLTLAQWRETCSRGGLPAAGDWEWFGTVMAFLGEPKSEEIGKAFSRAMVEALWVTLPHMEDE